MVPQRIGITLFPSSSRLRKWLRPKSEILTMGVSPYAASSSLGLSRNTFYNLRSECMTPD